MVNSSGNHPKEIAKIKNLCGEKFAESLIASMKARDQTSKLSWKWDKELSKPKLMSFLSYPVIEDHPESEIVQAVIRIHGKEVCLAPLC